MNIKIGRSNFALTVFVPYDCANNCAFCTSKQNYKTSPPNVDKVIKKMEIIFRDYTFPIQDVVITGGEPMADIDILKRILNTIPDEYNVYINTTFIHKNFIEFCEIVNKTNKIKGINISRHFDTFEKDNKFFKDIATDEKVRYISKKVRINCVVNKSSNIDGIIDRWSKQPVELSFRRNFNTPISDRDLHNMYDDFLLTLSETENTYFVSHGQCDVCDTTRFLKDETFLIQYHKTKKHSSFKKDGVLTINDLIIFQNGDIAYDWEDTLIKTTQEVLDAFLKKAPRGAWALRETKDYWYVPTGPCGGDYYNKPKEPIQLTVKFASPSNIHKMCGGGGCGG